ncbi:MAG: S-layer homology domain-containing protein [Oscillospiraceae bacterium]|nr:S-layer homology domain-containing protein [Oscillospiraceae bacterium]
MKKKFLAVILCLVLAVGFFAVPAGASNYDSAAEQLKEMNLFRGSDIGFELDRPATRVEAAIMLVRLFGAEDGAVMDFEQGNISHPFNDVPTWADYAIAWLYSNGLTKGVSDTQYGKGDCTAQMYCTFILRALGYTEEAGDFTYDQAIEKATQLGIYNSDFISEAFIRDDLVALSYQALATSIKGENTSLVKSLVEGGAVDSEAAADFIKKSDMYRQYVAATAAFAAMDTVAMKMTSIMEYYSETTPSLNSVETTFSEVRIVAGDDGSSDCYIFSDTDGEISEEWLLDGILYVDDNTGKYCVYAGDMSSEELISLTVESSATSCDPLFMIDSIVKNPNGSYTFRYDSSLDAFMSNYLEQQGIQESAGTKMKISFPVIETTVSFDYNGNLDTNVTYMEMVLTLTVDGETHVVNYTYSITTDVTGYGDNVFIEVPNLDEFIPYSLPTV